MGEITDTNAKGSEAFLLFCFFHLSSCALIHLTEQSVRAIYPTDMLHIHCTDVCHWCWTQKQKLGPQRLTDSPNIGID